METDRDDPGKGKRVVREHPVYVAAEPFGQGGKVAVLQYPLRPPWRPYLRDEAPSMQVKPKAVRVELEFAGNEEVGVPALRMRSTATASETLSLGVLRPDGFFLMPLHKIYQMRPDMSRLDKAQAEAASKGTSMKEEDGTEAEADAGQAEPVRVKVLRRETERQQELRESSFAYLSQQERDEPWEQMQVYLPETAMVREAVKTVCATSNYSAVVEPMAPSRYVETILPAVTGDPDEEERPPQAGPAPEDAEPLSRAELAALERLITGHLKRAHVVNLVAVRALAKGSNEDGVARVAQVSDKILLEAIGGLSSVKAIGKRFMLATMGDPKADKLREILIGLLRQRDSVRKVDVMESARLEGLDVDDNLYARVLRSVCQSRGSLWSLKSGDL